MTTVFPSTLTASLTGSTRTQATGFLSYAQPGDVIIYSSVALYVLGWPELFTEMKQKVDSGVNLILLIPQNWCTDNYFPSGCFAKGSFGLTGAGVSYLKEMLTKPNCIPIYTTDAFRIHLKACDWISFNGNNPKAAVYFGSSNFYNSFHDEVGLYVYGDYTKNDMMTQVVLSRALMISDYAKMSNTTRMTPAQKISYKYVIGKLNQIGSNAYPQGKNLPKAGANMMFPLGDCNFRLDYNETVTCNGSPATMLTNKYPVANNSDTLAMKGGFRIALSPPTNLWYNLFAKEIDMITQLFHNAKEYVKVSVMELYLDDQHYSSDWIRAQLVQLIKDAVKRGINVQMITNVGLNWAKHPPTMFHLSYKGLVTQLSGKGTLEIRYRSNGSQLHTKMYVSDQDVIISSQHPSQSFLTYVYGSSIMFDDFALREYYDNFFNALWYGSYTANRPDYNRYPVNLVSPFMCKNSDKVYTSPHCCTTAAPPKWYCDSNTIKCSTTKSVGSQEFRTENACQVACKPPKWYCDEALAKCTTTGSPGAREFDNENACQLACKLKPTNPRPKPDPKPKPNPDPQPNSKVSKSTHVSVPVIVGVVVASIGLVAGLVYLVHRHRTRRK